MASLASSIPQNLFIIRKHWRQMQADVERRAPQEACGLVAGLDNTSLAVFPISNALQSPTRFRMDPRQQLEAFNQMDEKDWVLLAIYHSHPKGPMHPSPTDIAEAAYPEAVNLIWFPFGGRWQCRGFIIQQGKVHEIPVAIQDSE